MNTYWDEFMDLLQAGKINDEYGHPLAITFLTPRRMLEAFYGWLSEKGQIVHGCPHPLGVETAFQQGYNAGTEARGNRVASGALLGLPGSGGEK